MAAVRHRTLYTQGTQGGNDTDACSDNTTSKRASIHTTNPTTTTTGWRRLIASRPRSHSSGNIDTHSSSRESEKLGQKQEYTFGEAPWSTENTTTTTVDANGQHLQIAGAGIHRRLCFSLDEKALFDLHHPQYSSTASQQQCSTFSEQSPAFEAIKPPFAPPERVKTPDGVPSWPGVMETCTHSEQHSRERRTGRTSQRRLVRMFSRIFEHRRDNRNSKRSRISRALGLKRPRQEQRSFAQWRPPMSGHSTFRFST